MVIPWIRFRNGKRQVLLPLWCYDLCCYVFFPLNWLIATIACRWPSRYSSRNWATDPELAPAKLPKPETDLKILAAAIRARDDTKLSDRDVWCLFDSLPAPKTNDMIGNWRGKVVMTGSWLDVAGRLLEKPLGKLGLVWGKRFFTPYKGDPFIVVKKDTTILPVPVWGNVTMPETGLRGKVGATMVYDNQPWKDYFRVLDDGKSSGRKMMLGNWFSREKNGGWFTLESLPEFDEGVADLLKKSPY
jgi:hypothetical protein